MGSLRGVKYRRNASHHSEPAGNFMVMSESQAIDCEQPWMCGRIYPNRKLSAQASIALNCCVKLRQAHGQHGHEFRANIISVDLRLQMSSPDFVKSIT